MTNSDKIVDCFRTLVGFRESAKAGSCYDMLTDELKQSDSGLYYNGLSGISLENINAMLGSDNTSVNDYLSSVIHDCSIDLINRFKQSIKNVLYSKEILSNYDFGIYVEANKKVTNKYNRFVGYKIKPHESNSISAEIVNLGGMFKKHQVLPIYFYSSLQDEPIYIFNVETKPYSFTSFDLAQQISGSGSSSSQIQLTKVIMNYINNDIGSNADYFIGYYESDLDADNYAIQTIYPAGGCTSCGSNSYTRHLSYVSIFPISVQAGNTYSDKSLFDTNNIGYEGETFGLFLKLNVGCDISQVICENRLMFAKCLQKMVATRILWDCFNSNELNHIGSTKKQDFKLLAEKYENELFGVIVDGRFMRGEVELLSLDFSNLDEECLGKRKGAMGIMYL